MSTMLHCCGATGSLFLQFDHLQVRNLTSVYCKSEERLYGMDAILARRARIHAEHLVDMV